MKHNVKVFLIYFISFIAIFSLSRYLLELLLPDFRHLYLMIAAAIITLILSPRLDKEESGRYILKWIFKKGPLIK